MDFFTSEGDEKMSLHDMIECDLNGLNGEMGASPTPMITLNLPLDFMPEIHHDMLCIPMCKAQTNGFSSVDISSALSGDGSITLQGIQAQLFLQSENGNPNLMVNPTTGLPVQPITKVEEEESIAMTTDSIEPESVLNNKDVPLASPNPSTQIVYPVKSPQPPKQTTHHPLTQTLLSSQITNQASQPLQSIQNTNVSYHQTLTHHLLSNNNIRKLQKDPNEKVWPKPVYSYSCLIAMALKNSETGALPVSEIYSFMTEHFPYFKTAPDGWKNSVRHNLSLNKCFEKIENPRANGNTRKGCLWGLNPHKIEKMEDEIVKWRKKDPAAVKRSMSHPEKLEEIERGRIGSHAPLPPEYLRALREQQLVRLNNMHASTSALSNGGSVSPSAHVTTINGNTGSAGTVNLVTSQPTLTMVTPVYVSNSHGRLTNGGTITLATTTTKTINGTTVNGLINGAVTVKKTAAQLLAAQQQTLQKSQLTGGNGTLLAHRNNGQLNTQAFLNGDTRVLQTKSSKEQGGVQVTMVEVVPANKVQQIKTEPNTEEKHSNTADNKPIVINFQTERIKLEKKEREVDENLVLDNNLLLDPTLNDLALQNGLWDELSSEGIDFSDLPPSALNLSFSTTPSPKTVLTAQNGTKSPLIGLLQSRTISAKT